MHSTKTIVNWLVVLAATGITLASTISTVSADTYTYDQYGRLTGVTYSDGSSVTYTYDAAGNRIVVSTTSP